MDEREARMRLLEDELAALHASISAHDGRMAQVKGWCVTVASGLLALAITQDRPALAFCAGIAVMAFWLAESHIALIQRVMIQRHQQIERHFQAKPVLEALDDPKLVLPAMAGAFIDPQYLKGWFSKARDMLTRTMKEALSPYRTFFYILVLVGVVVIVAAASVL